MHAMKPPAFVPAAVLSALLLAPMLAFAATLTRGPYLQMGNDSAMTVRWRSDVATDSRVRVGTDPSSLTLIYDNATSTTEHVVRITGLAANTKYYYSVGSTTQTLIGDTTTHFETAPPPGTRQPIRVWVIGDAGTGSSGQAAVRDAYYNHTGSTYTDLWLQLGDNAYSDGTDAEFQAKMFNVYSAMLKKSPTWPTLGNHDGHSADSGTQSGPYYDIFTLPKNAESGGIASGTEAYYSFDYGNIHFVVLDSYDSSRAVGSPMLNWLEADLQATNADWIVAFWHHPPYSKGSHNSDTETAMIEMRVNVLPILENHGVDLVLAGHSHAYERSKFIDNHYGGSSTFSDSTHVVQSGSGRIDLGGAYTKPEGGAAHAGAVYTVAGSSGQTSGGTLNHPAMFLSLNVLGSMVLDVNGLTLDAKFLDNTGATRDYFTISKGAAGPSISGVAWDDADTDGIRETGEAKRQNIETRLYTSGGTLVATKFTAADGSYSFTNVASGNYYVQFIKGTLTISPQNLGGNDAVDSDANPTDGRTAVFSVAGSNIANVDVGMYSAGGGTSTTVSFQDGLNGYAGTQDTYVASGASGSNFGGATAILGDGDDGSRDRLVSLLKWNVTSIPAGKTVTAASVTLQVFDPSSGTYNLNAMNLSWSESSATWSNTNPPNNLGSLIGSFVPSGNGSYTINLNSAGIALVHGWVNGTVTNNGIMVIDGGTTNGVDLRSSEYGTQNVRPKLTVTYQ